MMYTHKIDRLLACGEMVIITDDIIHKYDKYRNSECMAYSKQEDSTDMNIRTVTTNITALSYKGAFLEAINADPEFMITPKITVHTGETYKHSNASNSIKLYNNIIFFNNDGLFDKYIKIMLDLDDELDVHVILKRVKVYTNKLNITFHVSTASEYIDSIEFMIKYLELEENMNCQAMKDKVRKEKRVHFIIEDDCGIVSMSARNKVRDKVKALREKEN